MRFRLLDYQCTNQGVDINYIQEFICVDGNDPPILKLINDNNDDKDYDTNYSAGTVAATHDDDFDNINIYNETNFNVSMKNTQS